ncbi:MAG: TatD family hydrolase [Candidatus Limnocylindrales bacterium]
MRLVDSHCHLQSERFGADADAVIEAARTAGVERILVPGWNAWSSSAALDLVDRHPWMDAAVGVHPHDAAKVTDAEWAGIVAAAADPRVVAIGETGLDFDRVFSPIPDQLQNLRRNLRLASDAGKPAILHCRSKAGERDAQDALLNEVRAVRGLRPIIHSFSGPLDYAVAMLDLGASISISGLAFRGGEESTASVAAIVPADRLLVETDSPFLTPPGGPRGRNEPAAVAITARWVAAQRTINADPEAVAAALGSGLVEAYDRAFR